MKNIGFLITARLKSSRLPLKLLKRINGKPIIHHVIDRIKMVGDLNTIVLCTSVNAQDDPLMELSNQQGIDCFRGDELDVLQRLLDAAEKYKLDYIIGITGENPLFSIKHTKEVIQKINHSDRDFICPVGLPIGCATYGIKVSALKLICSIKEVVDTEIWGYLINRPEIFDLDMFSVELPYHWPELRITIDYPEDFNFVSKIFEDLNDLERTDLKVVLNYLKTNPEVTKIHSSKKQLDLDENTKAKINQFYQNNKQFILEQKKAIESYDY